MPRIGGRVASKLSRDRVALSGGGFGGDPILQPRNDGKSENLPVRSAVRASGVQNIAWESQMLGKAELPRHDADDGIGGPVQRHRPTHDRRIGSKVGVPRRGS